VEKNAVQASFCGSETKELLLSKLEAYCRINHIDF